MSTVSVSTLINQLKALDATKVANDENERLHALSLCKKLTAELESPVNRATDLMFQPLQTVAARIGVDLDLYQHIVSAPGGSISTKELAKITGGKEDLIARILRYLAAIYVVGESSEGEWFANETTRIMATAPIKAGYRYIFDFGFVPAATAPQFFRENQYCAITEPHDGLVQHAFQTKLATFDYLISHKPNLFQDLSLFMGHTLGARESHWYKWYDVSERLLHGFNESNDSAEEGEVNAFIVDVGGGKGHDLQSFVEASKSDGKEYNFKGNLVLQDQKHVIDNIPEGSLDPSIKKQAHDFFNPQPITGARTYFLHHILHDWPDKYCQIILSHLKDAMKPGYSKLLIHELILPNTRVEEIQARFDFGLMLLNGGAERSRSQWLELLEGLGFDVEIHEHPGHDGIIEATLPVPTVG